MSADSAIAEALSRIEHKVDLTLRLLTNLYNTTSSSLVLDHEALGSPKHTCPVCGQVPQYRLDIANAIVTRKCGCSTGLTPIDLKALEPSPIARRETHVGREEGIEDDRPNPGGNRGYSGPGGPPRR